MTRVDALSLKRSRTRKVVALLVTLLTVSLGHAQGLQASFSNSQVRLRDGETRNLTVLVENGTPEEATVASEVMLPPGFILAMPPPPLTLGPGETRPVFLSVLTPTGTPPGDYAVSLDLQSERGESLRVTGTLRVFPRTQVVLSTISHSLGEARWERSFEIEVLNSGNTTEQVRFELESAPSAIWTIEPSEVALAPGESTRLTASASSPVRETGQQRLRLRALADDTTAPLAEADLSYLVLGSSSRLRETERTLNFSVRLTYSPGANLSRPGLGAVGVSLRGGGLIDPDGNQRVRATISTRGFDSATAAGAYTSDALDVVLGVARRDYSTLGFSASGYGLTVDAEIPETGITVGSYVLGERDLSAFTGIGAQVAGVGNGISGGVQFTYDPASERGVLSANTSFSPVALGALYDPGPESEQGSDGEAQPDEPAASQEAAIEEVRSELDEASDDLPDGEAGEEQAIEAVESSLQDAIGAAVNTVIGVEGAVDTVAGVAGLVQARIGAGPVGVSANFGGATAGFRGDSLSQREWGVGGNVSLGTVGGVGIGVGAEYRATDRFTGDASKAREVDALALGLGINAENASVSVTYSTSLQTAPSSGSWSRDQRFGVSTRALLEVVSLNASLSWLARHDSQANGSMTGSLLEIDAAASVPTASGAIVAEGELQYDLLTQQIVNLNAEAVAVLEDVASLNGDMRFGVKYRRSTDFQWITGLARWTGNLTSRLSVSAGLQGTFAFVDDDVRRSVSTSVSTSTLLPLGHRLGLGGSVQLQDSGRHSATLNASYTVPFSVPVARIEGLGDLHGVLLYPDGEPVAGVELRVGRAAVVTDEDGSFRVEGLPAGEHTLLATSGLSSTVAEPKLPLRVTIPDREVLELTVTVHPAAAVEGRVTLAVPEPLPGVIYGSGDRVRDMQTTRGMQLRLVNADHEYVVTTSQTGRFTLPAVMPGTYTVEIDTDVSGLYSIEVANPVLTLEADQAAVLEVIVHPLPRHVQMQETGIAGEGNER